MSKVFDAYAAYYDLLYKDKDYAGEAEFVAALLRKHGVQSGAILELGCGTGKHAEYFARMGFRVHGLDISPAMVAAANARKPAGLSGLLDFEVGDVRAARVDRRFDAVVSLFHVASYQTTNEDLLAMFRTAAAHLKRGGLFVFDFWHGPGVLRDPPAVRVKRMSGNGVDVLRLAEPTLRCNDNVVEVKYTIIVSQQGNDRNDTFTEIHPMRYWFSPEISHFLAEEQFLLTASCGWLSSENLDFHNWLGVVLARKI